MQEIIINGTLICVELRLFSPHPLPPTLPWAVAEIGREGVLPFSTSQIGNSNNGEKEKIEALG